MQEMFCFQCQQTAHNTGCDGKAGVCGKKADTANYQDELIGALIGLARAVQGGTATDCTDELKALEQERTGLGIEYNKTLDVLSSKQTYDRINALIEDAHKDLKMYQEQLDNLDDKITVANDYYQHSCDVLEQDINKMFSYVKWTMFQSTQDGERKPYCECHHDGVPYGSLNAAAKVNAGIDIANVVSKFYDVSVPMILDECESNLHPIYEGGQQIRLCVSPSPKLEISYGD